MGDILRRAMSSRGGVLTDGFFRFRLGFFHFFGDHFDRFVQRGSVFGGEILPSGGVRDAGELPVGRSVDIEADDMGDEVDPFGFELFGRRTRIGIAALFAVTDEDDGGLILILAQ